MVAVYVDNIVIFYRSIDDVNEFKRHLKKRFCMKEMGEIARMNRWKVEKTQKGCKIGQEKYIRQLIKKYVDFNKTRPTTPLKAAVLLHNTEDKAKTVEKTWYPSVIGLLLYIATSTRADICFAVRILSRHMRDLCKRHGTGLKRLLGYVGHIRKARLFFKRD
jgi:Reverse transcriptase (RNA-dependent DNA polymerase)